MDPTSIQFVLSVLDNMSPTIKSAESSVSNLGDTAKAASEKTGLLGTALQGLASGIAVGAGIAAATEAINDLGAAIPKAIDQVTTFGQQVLTLSRQTGATAETSSELLDAFERFGVSSQQASVSLGLFSKNLNTYADSTQAAQSKSTGFAGAIDSLGLTVKDSSGALIPMSDQLLNVADRFAAMPDGIQKTADAVALFGRSGKDMIPVLDQGREGLQEAMDAAEKYGLVLNGSDIDAVKQFGFAHKDLDEAMSGVTLQIGVALIPALAKLAEGVAGLAQGFNQSVMPALKEFGAAIDSFVQSDAFQMWAARLLVVIGLIGDGIGALSGVFFTSLGGILDVVNTVGQAIYTGLQWLNPFAAHSPPLVSQVQDGVAAISAAFGSLSGITSTFDGIGTAFEDLATKTSAFSDTVDDVSTKTEKALAVMGPDVTDAFNAASDAVASAKDSLADIKSNWDDATAALVPLKDNLDSANSALKDQQGALSDLNLQLSDAQAAFTPLNTALTDAKKNATDAESAIKSLTSTPIAGTAAFDKQISDANIALKTQALALDNIKTSTAYTSLGDQIDAASAKLKAMQTAQAITPALSSTATTSQRSAATDAANKARTAIAEQQAAIDALKTKQTDLLDPAQKKLALDQASLATINLQKDATIGVAQEQIKQAGQAASGVTEQTQAQIEAALAAAGVAKAAATSQVDTLTPQVAAQQAAIDLLKGSILAQQHAVDDAKKSADAANQTYSDAKKQVDDLGTAYRDTKQEIANYDAQLKATLATGDTQVQKIAAAAAAVKAQAAAAKSAASAAGKTTDAPTAGADDDSLATNLANAKKSADNFSKALDQAKTDVAAFFKPVTDAAIALGTFLAPLSDIGQALTTAAVAFGIFALAIGPIGGILGIIGAALALLLTPVGLVLLAVAGLGAAIATNFGGIRDALQPAMEAFAGLTPILANFGLAFQKALGGDFSGAVDTFLATLRAVGGVLGPVIAGWAIAFTGWILPILPGLLKELGDLTLGIIKWALDVGDQLLAQVLLWAGAFLDWVEPIIPLVVGELAKLSLAVYGWILSVADVLVSHLLVWGTAFITWLEPQIPGILGMLSAVALKIIDWIAQTGTMLAEHLGKWAAEFIDWIIPLLPGLATALEQIASNIIDFVFKAVPKILGAVAGWAGAFLGWVLPLLPGLLVALGEMIAGLAVWIVTVAAPKIGEGLVEWGNQFVAWIEPLLPPLATKLGEIKDAVVAWIIAEAEAFGTQLLEWGKQFIAWVAPIVKALPGELLTLDGAIIDWITAETKALTTKITTEWGPAFLSWIGQVLTDLPSNIKKILDWFDDWLKNTAIPWISTNLPAFGTEMVNAIISGFSTLGSLIQSTWESISFDAGPIHFDGKTGFSWVGPSITIPMPTLGGASTVSPAAASSTNLATAPNDTPGGPVDLTHPVGQNNARGPASLPGGNPQAGGSGAGLTAAEIASICGPIAAALVSQYLGQSVDLVSLVHTSEQQHLFNTGQGTMGNAGEIGILKDAGISATTVSMADAINTLAAGVPVIINTLGHFFEATSYDAATGKFGLGGGTGAAVGLGSSATLSQLTAKEGPLQGFIAPTTGQGPGNANMNVTLPDPAALKAMDAILQTTTLDAQGVSTAMSTLGVTITTNAQAAGKSLAQYLQDTGATAINTSTASMDDLEKATGLTLPQIQTQAGAAGLDLRHWLLEVGVPAAQALAKSVGTVGENNIWTDITSNAAIAGKSLQQYLAGTGVSAIDVTSAGLDALEKASGLSLPQMQQMAQAAGKDLKTWLQDTGVPAAQKLAGSLGTDPTGLAGSAAAAVKPIQDTTGAVTPMGKAMDVAASTQIAAVLLDLRDGMLGINKHSDGNGLIQNIKDFTTALNAIHDVSVTVTTNYVSNGSPSAAGGASGSSGSAGGGSSSAGSGASGPGGVLAQAAQDAANAASRAGAAVAASSSSLASVGGPTGTGGGGQLINSSSPGAGRTNPNQFALGGLVGGPIGSAVSAIVHGGEMVLTPQVLDHLRDTFKALPSVDQVTFLSNQVASTLTKSSSTVPGGAAQLFVPRPAATPAPAQAQARPIDYDQLGAAVAKALRANPPRVSVEEVRASLIRVGRRNGGQVGLG